MENFGRASFEELNSKLTNSTETGGIDNCRKQTSAGRDGFEEMKERHKKEEEDFINREHGIAIQETEEQKKAIVEFIEKAHREALYMDAENSEDTDRYLQVFKEDLTYKGDDRNSWSLSTETLQAALNTSSQKHKEEIIKFVIKHHSSDWLLSAAFFLKDEELAKAVATNIESEIKSGTYKGDLTKISSRNQDSLGILSFLKGIEEEKKQEQRIIEMEQFGDVHKWTKEQLKSHGAEYILLNCTEEEIANLKSAFDKRKGYELPGNLNADKTFFDWVRETTTFEGNLSGLNVTVKKMDEFGHWSKRSGFYNEIGEPQMTIKRKGKYEYEQEEIFIKDEHVKELYNRIKDIK